MYLASYVKDHNNLQIILLGGMLQPYGQSLVGPLTKEAVKAFHVDKIFTGTDGYSRAFGFTGDDLSRSDTLNAMTDCADHTYVLAGSEKFTRPGSVSFVALKDVDEVITDDGIPAEEKDYLTKQGIIVTIA